MHAPSNNFIQNQLKVDEFNQTDYLAKGMKLFRSSKERRHAIMESSTDVLEDKNELLKWVNKAYQVALANKK